MSKNIILEEAVGYISREVSLFGEFATARRFCFEMRRPRSSGWLPVISSQVQLVTQLSRHMVMLLQSTRQRRDINTVTCANVSFLRRDTANKGVK